MAKTSCPVSRTQFDANAKPVVVAIGESKIIAVPKQFNTGSMGWGSNEKMVLMIEGVPCMCQVGLNVTIIGSKDLPEAA